MDPTICSSAGKCKAEGDIWDAPDGRIGLNFDDGPWLGTTKLLNFLDGVNQTATMYLIGKCFSMQTSEFSGTSRLKHSRRSQRSAVASTNHPRIRGRTRARVPHLESSQDDLRDGLWYPG